jgi:hypothetical protein
LANAHAGARRGPLPAASVENHMKNTMHHESEQQVEITQEGLARLQEMDSAELTEVQGGMADYHLPYQSMRPLLVPMV